MQKLVKMSQHQLEQILGSDSNAQLLWQFLHSNIKYKLKSKDILAYFHSPITQGYVSLSTIGDTSLWYNTHIVYLKERKCGL